MTRFRDLLRFDPALSPAEEQARASRKLPEAVAQSNLRSEATCVPAASRCLAAFAKTSATAIATKVYSD